MILPETIEQEQLEKQEQKRLIISIALELYPHLIENAGFYDSAAKQSFQAAKVFVQEAHKFEV